MKKIYGFVFGDNTDVTPKNYKTIKNIHDTIFYDYVDKETKDAISSFNEYLPEFNIETDILIEFCIFYYGFNKPKGKKENIFFCAEKNFNVNCYGGDVFFETDLPCNSCNFESISEIIIEFEKIAKKYRSMTKRNDIFYEMDGYLKFYENKRKRSEIKKIKSFIPKQILKEIKNEIGYSSSVYYSSSNEQSSYQYAISKIKFLLRFKSKSEKAKFKLML